MFQLILKYRKRYKLYIDYRDNTWLSLYQKLLELGRSELGDNVHVCLSIFLRVCRESVAYMQTTFVYMEMHCEYPVSSTYRSQFILFFKLWLERINATQFLEFPRHILERFVARIPPELLQETNCLMSYLDDCC